MLKLPLGGQWAQPNKSDKFGSLWGSKNLNLDEAGYIKLSPRAVKLYDEATNNNFNLPVSIGRYSQGEFQVATHDSNWVADIDTAAFSLTEDTGTSNPTCTVDSHGVFWQDRWHVSTATAVLSKAANGGGSSTWTSRITGLTSGVSHVMCVFESRNDICVANGNVVKQYDTSYASTTDLTIPADYEVVGLAYNDSKMGVITQSGQGSLGQVMEATFFTWDGSTTEAGRGYKVGAEKCLAIVPYKTSFAILTSKGVLKFFNGGGFTELAQFPFVPENLWLDAIVQMGNCMWVEDDKIFINLGLSLTAFGEDEQRQIINLPSGVWCYDPKVGLYHRYSVSTSQAYLIVVNGSGADTSTDIMTAASGTIPATGNPIRIISGESIGGLTKNKVYFVIKHSSTTFSVALTKEQALAGVKVDVTTTNGDATRFHAYDLVDYGVTYRNDMAALAWFGETRNMYTDIIFGGDCPTLAGLAANDVLSYCVPGLENRGWLLTPRVYASKVEGQFPKLNITLGAVLKDTDSIIVKVKDRDIVGLPMSAPCKVDSGSDEIIFTGPDEGYTSANLDGAKDYFDTGGELEMEFTAGAGAGQCVKITAISYSGGVYTLEFEDEIVGATASTKAYFIVNNWRKIGSMTSADNHQGFKSFNPESRGSFVQFKVELRGTDIKIAYVGLSETDLKAT